MYMRMGNLSVEQFAEYVGAVMKPEEVAYLEGWRTREANFTDPDKFHIFDDPAVVIMVGSKCWAETRDVWLAINARQEFRREVSFYPIPEPTPSNLGEDA